MRTTWLATLALGAILAAGCSGSSGSTAKPAPPANASVIRGAQLPTFSCAAASDGVPVKVAPASVTRIRLCTVPGYPRPSPAVDVDPTNPGFGRLVRALAAPDQKRTNGICPAYANVPQLVIGDGPAGPLVIHIPVDSCNHYLGAALSALNALRPQA